jgi:hypothetical protein
MGRNPIADRMYELEEEREVGHVPLDVRND